MLGVALAVLHILALAMGLPAVIVRAWALGRVAHGTPRGEALRAGFAADALWGGAAVIWIGTGLWRYLGGLEKGTAYYDRNHIFLAKLGLLAVVLLVEIWPMVKLIQWRIALRRGATPDAVALPETARRIAALSWAQAVLVVTMVFLASAMARGFGVLPGG